VLTNVVVVLHLLSHFLIHRKDFVKKAQNNYLIHKPGYEITENPGKKLLFFVLYDLPSHQNHL